MTIRILGKLWRFVMLPRTRLAHLHGGRGSDRLQGYTEHPSKKAKRIFVGSDLSPRTELETTIHELLHAADWTKDEEWVEEAAADIARCLWRLGWRKDAE